MRFSGARLAATLPLLLTVLASDVVVLNKDNFVGEIADDDLSLVEFYAPWCGHCKNLAPEYDEAAATLKPEGIKLAKIDCDDADNKPLCQEYGVQGYPTLKVFRKGQPQEYGGPRKAPGIVSYMRKQNLPAVSELNADNHDDFIKTDDVVIVAYGDAKHPVPAVFDEYASSARDEFVFGKFEDGKLPKLPSKVSLPAIVLYKKFDEGHAVFNADVATAELAELAAFTEVQSVPLFDQIGPENFQKYAKSGTPLGFFFLDPEDVKGREKIVADLTPVFKENRAVVNFVWIDGVQFIDYGKNLGIEDIPAFVIQDINAQTKYVYTGKLDEPSISKFVSGVAGGSIKPTLKSGPIPETQGAVYKLVSNDWDNLFGNEDKDIFVEFFAPWCGHCKRLAPIWETLGEKYANTNVVIAQSDLTENDLPEAAPFQVQGFPTLKFRAAGSSEFIDYEGDRSLESLVEFVEANSKSSPLEKRAEAADEADEEEEAHARDEL